MALGKGLGAILEEIGYAYEEQLEESRAFDERDSKMSIHEIDVELISPNPYQPRKHFDQQALEELSQSIVNHGLLQPVVVIEKENGYILISGERRLRAHKLAKLETIKAIVADVTIDDVKQRELALIENIQREDLNAIELANSYSELIEVHQITHDELSMIVHKSRSQITNTIRLLTLSPYVKDNVLEGKLSQGHAKVLVGLEEDKQRVVVDTIIGQKLSVRETENLVKKYKSNSGDKTAQKTENETHFMDKYFKDLKRLLPFTHKIHANKITISFDDEIQLQEFIEIIKKS